MSGAAITGKVLCRSCCRLLFLWKIIIGESSSNNTLFTEKINNLTDVNVQYFQRKIVYCVGMTARTLIISMLLTRAQIPINYLSYGTCMNPIHPMVRVTAEW